MKIYISFWKVNIKNEWYSYSENLNKVSFHLLKKKNE